MDTLAGEVEAGFEIDLLDIQSNMRVSKRPQFNAIGQLWSTIA